MVVSSALRRGSPGALRSGAARALAWAGRPEGQVVLTVLVWSACVHLLALMGARLIDPHAHPGQGSLSAAWQHWDGNWFARIVGAGYHALPDARGLYLQAAFYPGYPLVGRGVFEVLHPLGVGTTGALLLVNQLLVVGMALLVFMWARELTNAAAGVQTVRYLLLFPYAYFLLAPYSEALFLTFLAAFGLALNRRRYVLAGLLGAGACATRFVGIALSAVLLIDYLEQHEWRVRSLRPRVVAAAALPLAGIAAYALYQLAEFGDAFYSERMSRLGWARTFTLKLWDVVSQQLNSPYLTAGRVHGVPFEVFVLVPLLAGFAALTWIVWRRFGAALGVMCALLLVLPIVSGSSLSLNRYLLPLIPCFVVLAGWAGHALFDFAYRTLGAILLAVFVVMFTHGIWTG